MNKNPFLSHSQNPDWSTLTYDKVKADITLALEQAEEKIQKIRNLSSSDSTFENTVKGLELATHDLHKAWGLVTHLDSVCNSPELREVHNEMLPLVSAILPASHGVQLTAPALLL